MRAMNLMVVVNAGQACRLIDVRSKRIEDFLEKDSKLNEV
jgi:hypothetical protein